MSTTTDAITAALRGPETLSKLALIGEAVTAETLPELIERAKALARIDWIACCVLLASAARAMHRQDPSGAWREMPAFEALAHSEVATAFENAKLAHKAALR